MAASEPGDLLEAVLADVLGRRGSSGAEGAILDVPSGEAWTLAMPVTPLVRGDRVVVTRAGEASARWATLAGELGYDVVCIDVHLGELIHLLWWDPSIRAVFVAPGETSSGVTVDVGEVRRAMDLTGSDALLLVDCSASWDVDGLCQGSWRADLVVTATGAPGEDAAAGTLLRWSERLSAAAL